MNPKPKRPKAAKGQALSWPIFPSMRALVGVLGGGLPLLKLSKREGCAAFKANNRVDVLEWVKWLVAKEADDTSVDWGDKLKKYQAKREEIKLRKDEEQAIDRQQAYDVVSECVGVTFQEIERTFIAELPGVLEGLDAKEIKIRNKGEIEKVKNSVIARLEKLKS